MNTSSLIVLIILCALCLLLTIFLARSEFPLVCIIPGFITIVLVVVTITIYKGAENASRVMQTIDETSIISIDDRPEDKICKIEYVTEDGAVKAVSIYHTKWRIEKNINIQGFELDKENLILLMNPKEMQYQQNQKSRLFTVSF